ncbi:MAG: TolC family protein [Verrucomicrobiota bacterium]
MKRLHFCWPLFLTAALVGAMALPAKSQETTSTPPALGLSLDALVSEALNQNPELKFYESELAAARAGRKTAGAVPNPEVSGTIGRKTIHGSGAGAEGLVWSVSVVQPFEWPGRMGLRKAIANRDVELAELGFSHFKLALAGRVRMLAYGLFAAQEKAAAAREVAERFQVLREVVVQRDAAGLTPLLEVRIIEATELTLQRKAGDATLAAQSALLELNQLRGVAPNEPLRVAPPEIALQSRGGSGSVLAMAQTNNFDLRLRASELAQQGFKVELAKNERFPALSIGPTYSEERAGDRERIIGLGVSLPLPLWNRNGGNIDAARARQAQAEISFALAQRDVERKVLEASLTYETKVREMAKWRADSVQHFKEAAELADRHYRLGAVPISTYVELQKQYLEAVESLLETKQAALEAAARLDLLTGKGAP